MGYHKITLCTVSVYIVLFLSRMCEHAQHCSGDSALLPTSCSRLSSSPAYLTTHFAVLYRISFAANSIYQMITNA